MKFFGWLGLLLSALVSLGANAAFDPDSCQFIRDQVAGAVPGSTVEIPSGQYVCRTAIVLDRDGVTLEGSAGGVTLRLADHSNSPLLIIGHAESPPAAVHQVTVRNLTLDGNMAHQDMECWGGPCDSGGLSYNRNNGISVRGAFDCQVENVVTFANRSGGLVAERGTRRLHVDHFESHHNFFDGLAGYETEESVFSHIYLHHNRYAGISVDLHFNRNHFEDALLSGNGDVGIYARWSEGNTFDRMVVENSGNHGIYLAHDGDYSKCPLNYGFKNVEVRGNKGWGLWFNNAICDGTSFADSQFHDNLGGCYMVDKGGKVEMTNVTCQK